MHRKGVDILKEAYLKAFSCMDDVVLVIKDTGTRTVYRGGTEADMFRALAADDSRPAVIYLDDDLTPRQLAGLYAAADCVVLPYRGEGFCLPALESLSAGVPVIVPTGGPTDDFVDSDVGWVIKTVRRPFGGGRIGELDCCGPTWMLEPDLHELADAMREAYCDPDAAAAKGAAGRERVLANWTWDHTVAKVKERIRCSAIMREEGRGKSGEGRSPIRPTISLNRQLPNPPTPFPESLAGLGGKGESSSASGRLQKGFKVRDMGAMTARLGSGIDVRDRRSGKLVRREPQLRRPPSISLCMIVRDEERVLDACLSSAKPYFDEMIVVDTGSTDSTVEIAMRHGAKVSHFPWCNDFSAARNVSLEAASGDWCCWIDADDVLPPECGAALRRVINLAEDRVTGYLMQVHIPPAPGAEGFTQVDHCKAFRLKDANGNKLPVRFEGRIHEQCLESIYACGGIIERTDIYVVHAGYDYSETGQAKKKSRDYTILALDEAERSEHPFPRFNFGMTLMHHGEYDLALQKLHECLERSKPHESTVRKVYAMMCECYVAKGDLAAARAALDKGLERTPQDPELLFRAGNLYRQLGDPAAAERFYLRLLNSRETGHIDSMDVTMTSFKAHHNLALVYTDLQRHAEAEHQWRAAINDKQNFAPSWQGLGELYIRLRRFDDARAVLQKLETLSAEHAQALRGKLAEQAGLSF